MRICSIKLDRDLSELEGLHTLPDEFDGYAGSRVSLSRPDDISADNVPLCQAAFPILLFNLANETV